MWDQSYCWRLTKIWLGEPSKSGSMSRLNTHGAVKDKRNDSTRRNLQSNPSQFCDVLKSVQCKLATHFTSILVAEILKYMMRCDDLIGWLSLKDKHTFDQACTTFHDMADRYSNENYCQQLWQSNASSSEVDSDILYENADIVVENEIKLTDLAIEGVPELRLSNVICFEMFESKTKMSFQCGQFNSILVATLY